MSKLFSVVAVAGLAAVAQVALADVSVIGDVTNTTVSGNLAGTGHYTDYTNYHFYTFSANAGDTITFTAIRTTANLDPTVFVYEGNMNGAAFDGSNPFFSNTPGGWLGFSQVGFGDDEIPGAIPGPFADAQGSFLVGNSGTFTIVMMGNLSGANDGLGYQLTVGGSTSVPAPAAASLLGVGGLVGMRRRRAR